MSEDSENLELDLAMGMYYGKPKRSAAAPKEEAPEPGKRHFVFARCNFHPAIPSLKKPTPFAPSCWKTNLGMYKDVKAIKEWLGEFHMDSNIFKTWLCNFCGMHHYECYPFDLTGQTSGKGVRKHYWMILKGYAKTEYPDGVEKAIEKRRIEREVHTIVIRAIGTDKEKAEARKKGFKL